MQPENAKELLKKYREGTATDAEKELLGDWVLFGKLRDLDLTDAELEQELALLDEGLGLRRANVTRLWPRIAAAASLLLLLSVGGYLILHKAKETKQTQSLAQNQIHDIAPGGNKATLTLSDGRKIILSDAHNGTIASQGQTLINKTADGKLVYAGHSPSGTGSGELPAVYNTLTTKRGEQYQVILPDGSKVLLNAASSLRYPVAFTGTERLVELTGEGYFEVVHDSKNPFKVKVNGEIVEDVGTHFDLNAYSDEPAVRTTLLEGSVKVSGGNSMVMIKPGEQAILKNDAIRVVNADVDDAVAWANGLTTFESDDIYGVMRQVSRWYDVQVEYQGVMPQKHFSGAVSRAANLSEVLKVLELSGIHFKVQGKTITVMP
ncbi:MAG: FecR domain-containing protein [Bacteroidetes bacterium]|nr:FecR domain-containing protein [Bacteroidota bacterium]